MSKSKPLVEQKSEWDYLNIDKCSGDAEKRLLANGRGNVLVNLFNNTNRCLPSVFCLQIELIFCNRFFYFLLNFGEP
jgi:hypothetical protein